MARTAGPALFSSTREIDDYISQRLQEKMTSSKRLKRNVASGDEEKTESSLPVPLTASHWNAMELVAHAKRLHTLSEGVRSGIARAEEQKARDTEEDIRGETLGRIVLSSGDTRVLE